MKSKFSKSWNSSKQPRKQVKFRMNAPNHVKRKFMGCLLDKSLRTKYGRRNIEVRKGDEVKVMRGQFKGKQGKVGEVDVKNTRIQIEGIQRKKKLGGEKLITWFHPSKVRIIILNVDDKKRLKRSKIVGGEKVEEKKKEAVTRNSVPSKKGSKDPASSGKKTVEDKK